MGGRKGLLGQLGDTVTQIPNAMAGQVVGSYAEQGLGLLAGGAANVTSAVTGADVQFRGYDQLRFKGINGQQVRVGTSYNTRNGPAPGRLTDAVESRFGPVGNGSYGSHNANQQVRQENAVSNDGARGYIEVMTATEAVMNTNPNSPAYKQAVDHLADVVANRPQITMGPMTAAPTMNMRGSEVPIVMPPGHEERSRTGLRTYDSEQLVDSAIRQYAERTGLSPQATEAHLQNVHSFIAHRIERNNYYSGQGQDAGPGDDRRYIRQPEAGEQGYDAGAAAPGQPQIAPVPKTLPPGNGQTVDAAKASPDALLLSDHVLRDGKEMTAGERAQAYLIQSNTALNALPANATAADVNAAFGNDPAKAQRLVQLVAASTPQEQAVIVDQLNKTVDITKSKLSPEELAKAGPELEKMRAAINAAVANAGQQEPSQAPDPATGLTPAKRYEQLDAMKFDDTPDGKKLQEQYDAVVAKDRDLNSGGPMMVFFKKLISTITHAFGGGEPEPTPEEFLQKNASHLTKESKDALGKLGAEQAPATGTEAPKKDATATVDGNGNTVSAPPPPPVETTQGAATTAAAPATKGRQQGAAADYSDLQMRLEKLGFATDNAADGKVDGKLGQQTVKAVKQAEAHYGLAVDGKIDDALINKLMNDPALAEAKKLASNGVTGGGSVDAGHVQPSSSTPAVAKPLAQTNSI